MVRLWYVASDALVKSGGEREVEKASYLNAVHDGGELI